MNHKLLSEDVIALAVQGAAEAIECVLRHYSPYITRLASRNGYYDVEARCRMESKLAMALLTFKI